jgi:hypothetical protein
MLKEKFSNVFFSSINKIPAFSQQFLPTQGEADRRVNSTESGGAREADLLLLSCQIPSVSFRRCIKLNDSRTHNREYDKIDIYFTLLVFIPHFSVIGEEIYEFSKGPAKGLGSEGLRPVCSVSGSITKQTNKQTPWPESASELYRPSDRRLSAK